ncbi:MAG: TetR/AcrR family bet gene transcriptional repressor [Halocynthiibacter sp.]|jgi:TetR/AcrR family transcriptional repressor of bet genes
MEPIRRADLVEATISEIGRAGTLEVTVAQIARRAGVSSALAHHYFGSKERMFAEAMRHTLRVYGAEVRGALTVAKGSKGRIEAIIRVSFSAANFRTEVIAAWLNFYVQAQKSDEARRLLHIYQQRVRSNLRHDLRPLVGNGAGELARGIAAMIDGLYIRQALSELPLDAEANVALVLGYLETSLTQRSL